MSYREWLWSQKCPECGKGKGKLMQAGRVTGKGSARAVKVVCGDCSAFMRFRIGVSSKNWSN